MNGFVKEEHCTAEILDLKISNLQNAKPQKIEALKASRENCIGLTRMENFKKELPKVEKLSLHGEQFGEKISVKFTKRV